MQSLGVQAANRNRADLKVLRGDRRCFILASVLIPAAWCLERLAMARSDDVLLIDDFTRDDLISAPGHALARAHRWKRLLENGMCRSAQEIAEAEGITRSFVNRLLRLTLLAPDIQEAILDGRQPKGMQLEEITRQMPCEWEEKREAVAMLQRDPRSTVINP